LLLRSRRCQQATQTKTNRLIQMPFFIPSKIALRAILMII